MASPLGMQMQTSSTANNSGGHVGTSTTVVSAAAVGTSSPSVATTILSRPSTNMAAAASAGTTPGPSPPPADVPSGFILKLFQMVNGAPDDMITWTENGDAFVIKSDIKRLEAETLPQFFRHNRFQSLVRQLNFYSFRKVNRERNVWIYKHELFHRDRPEHLHMVRRRTCPGLDGRKQRVARMPPPTARRVSDSAESASRGNKPDTAGDDSSLASLEDSNIISTTSAIELDSSKSRKRYGNTRHDADRPTSKRTRNVWGNGSQERAQGLFVDTSLIEAAASEERKEAASAAFPEVALYLDEQVSLSTSKSCHRDDVDDSEEQAMTVSEVSKKLEQYALKAKGGGWNSRNRRGSGVVTPPNGSGSGSSTAFFGLLTYDDEYEYGYTGGNKSTVIADGDEGLSGRALNRESFFRKPTDTRSYATPKKATSAKTFGSAEADFTTPLVNSRTATAIKNRILASLPIWQRASVVAPVTAAAFCLSTSPRGDTNLSSKILQLIASSEKLSTDFQLYRAALEPAEPGLKKKKKQQQKGKISGGRRSSIRRRAATNAATTIHEILEHGEAVRSDAVRDFKTYAVNSMRALLGDAGGYIGPSKAVALTNLVEGDKRVLERAANLWLESIAISN